MAGDIKQRGDQERKRIDIRPGRAAPEALEKRSRPGASDHKPAKRAEVQNGTDRGAPTLRLHHLRQIWVGV